MLVAFGTAGCPRREAKTLPPIDPIVGELHIAFLIPPSFDASEGVATWRITVHDADGAVVTSRDIADGDPLRLDQLAPRAGVFIRLESFNDRSELLAVGRTVLLDLTPEAASTELYFAPPSSLLEVSGDEAGRSFPAVLGLSDGRVLIAGGVRAGTSEGADDTQVYDPRTNTVTDLPDLPNVQRFPAVFSPAPDVLVLAGGLDDAGDAVDLTQIFVWDPVASTGAWRDGAQLNEARADAAAVALGDGRTLLVAGSNGGGFLASTDLFSWDGAAGIWNPGPDGRVRSGAVALPLGGGRALIAGGRDAVESLDNVQLYVSDPIGGDTLTGADGNSLLNRRAWPGCIALSPTTWLLTGGIASNGNARDTTEFIAWDSALERVDVLAGPALPSPRWGGGSGTTADGRFVLVGGGVGVAPYSVAGLVEVLSYEGGVFVDLGVDTGDITVTGAVFPLADGTSLFVTDDDVLRYNPPAP